VGVVRQARAHPDSRGYLGSGKLEELHAEALSRGADLVVVDDELSPTQQRNMERAVDLPVLDRSELILDIFAQRARSGEGKLQVELAQLQYRLPRLTGRGKMLDRLGGGQAGGMGIGARGPGETKLEADRRRIRRRITAIQRSLQEVRQRRSIERKARSSLRLPMVAIVGYTNAGKSTLLNALSGSDIRVGDRLFETLDTTVRRVPLGGDAECLMSDTVGFIRRLPHHLVAAFRATLEEVVEADLLLHVVDAADPQRDACMEATRAVLGDLEAADKPRVTVFNKTDLAPDAVADCERCADQPCLPISALSGAGLDRLRQVLADLLGRTLVPLTLHVPYDQMPALHLARVGGRVLSQEYRGDKVVARVEVPRAVAGRLGPYVVSEGS
jgi:GTP-binding protein HflX